MLSRSVDCPSLVDAFFALTRGRMYAQRAKAYKDTKSFSNIQIKREKRFKKLCFFAKTGKSGSKITHIIRNYNEYF